MADANHRASRPAKKSGARASSAALARTAASSRTAIAAASTSAALAAPAAGIESSEPVYLLSEAAHGQLRAVQECLHLLSLLTQSRAEDPMVPPEAWTGCLHLLTAQLQSALDAAPWREAA